MAHLFADRVLEAATVDGTNDVTLAGAVAGYRAVSSVAADGDTLHYMVQGVDATGRPNGDWEVGRGTYSSGSVARTSVISSSTGSKVSFAAGLKQIALTVAAPSTATLAGDWRSAIGALAKGGDDLTGALNYAPTVSIASASNLSLQTRLSNVVEVTGTTAITALGTLPAGAIRHLRFTGSLTLTYNATSLILPGAANILVAAGDSATFESLGSGNWRCISYLRASGKSVVLPNATDIGLGSVTNESKSTMFNNSSLTGTTSGQNINLSNNLQATGQVSAGGIYGFVSGGYGSDGANYYAAGLQLSPNAGVMNIQGYHVPGSWFGIRMVLSATPVGVIEFRAQGGGTVVANGVQLTSDIRVKTNIKPITGVLDRLDGYQAVEFDRLHGPNPDGSLKHDAGTIAQWLEKNFPFLVEQDAPTEDDPDPIRRVNYNGLAAVATQGVLELRDEVRSQALLIKQLMERVAALEARA